MGKAMTQEEKNKYQAILDKHGLSRLSGIYYQLEWEWEPDYEGSPIHDFKVYHFKTVYNGNMFIEYKEERQYDGDKRFHVYGDSRRDKRVSKEEGNAEYAKLLSKGFKFAGIYVQDICGYSVRIDKEVV